MYEGLSARATIECFDLVLAMVVGTNNSAQRRMHAALITLILIGPIGVCCVTVRQRTSPFRLLYVEEMPVNSCCSGSILDYIIEFIF